MYLQNSIFIYLYLAAIGLTPGGSSTAHIYTKQYTEYRQRNIRNNKKEKFRNCGPCAVFASYTLALPYN
jgi:hypothetical protein